MQERDYYLESLTNEEKMYKLIMDNQHRFTKDFVKRALVGLRDVESRKYLYMQIKQRESKAPWES